jgi:hypothetical protein
VRFKSYALTPRSSAVPLWKLASDEWGVLASSSSRLGKDLYRYCFDDIYGQDSLFEVKGHGAPP